MIRKDELIERSPVRIFMKSISGGLESGELGIIASPSGIGKTSVLVQIALDKLLRGDKVIHVSFNQHTDYVLAWYRDIFDEFIKKKNLEDEQDVKNEITKNRVLMKFSQEGIPVDQILRGLRAMIKDGGFSASAIIVDGYKFSSGDRENALKFKKFGNELGLSIWFSCNVTEEPFYDKNNIPLVIGEYSGLFDVIAVLDTKQESRNPAAPAYIDLILSRNRDVFNPRQPALRLDPKTLLLLEDGSV